MRHAKRNAVFESGGVQGAFEQKSVILIIFDDKNLTSFSVRFRA
jgi:hypothetical protein